MIVVEPVGQKELSQAEFGDYGFFKSAFKAVRKVTKSKVFKYGVPIATGIASGFTASWLAKQAAGIAAKKAYHKLRKKHKHRHGYRPPQRVTIGIIKTIRIPGIKERIIVDASLKLPASFKVTDRKVISNARIERTPRGLFLRKDTKFNTIFVKLSTGDWLVASYPKGSIIVINPKRFPYISVRKWLHSPIRTIHRYILKAAKRHHPIAPIRPPVRPVSHKKPLHFLPIFKRRPIRRPKPIVKPTPIAKPKRPVRPVSHKRPLHFLPIFKHRPVRRPKPIAKPKPIVKPKPPIRPISHKRPVHFLPIFKHRPSAHPISHKKPLHILPVLKESKPYKKPIPLPYFVKHRPPVRPPIKPSSKPPIKPPVQPTPALQQKQMVELAKRLRAENVALYKEIVSLVNANRQYLKPKDIEKVNELLKEARSIIGVPRIINEDTIEDLKDLKMDLSEAKKILTLLIARRRAEYKRRLEEQKKQTIQVKQTQEEQLVSPAVMLLNIPQKQPELTPAVMPPLATHLLASSKPAVQPKPATRAAVITPKPATPTQPKPQIQVVAQQATAQKSDFTKYALLGGGLLIAVMLIANRGE